MQKHSVKQFGFHVDGLQSSSEGVLEIDHIKFDLLDLSNT
jgi:hypothetical protein